VWDGLCVQRYVGGVECVDYRGLGVWEEGVLCLWVGRCVRFIIILSVH
jgi:hypothetical protein